MADKKQRRIKSFRQTVVLLVWACVSVPVIILSTYQIRDDYQQQLESDYRELALESERTALVVSQELRQIMSDLDRVASDGSVIRSISMPILSPVSVRHLQEFLGSHPSASSIMLIDEEKRNLDYHFLLWQFKFDATTTPKDLGLDRIEAKQRRKPK